MVKKPSKSDKNSIKADVIVLGCTLPGIVAAHKLKRKFGDTMDIMVLDLGGNKIVDTKCNVAFQDKDDPNISPRRMPKYDHTAREILDNVARFYLVQYAKELRVPLPDAIINPGRQSVAQIHMSMPIVADEDNEDQELEEKLPLQKVFQYGDGNTVEFENDFHDFEYLNFLEKFELNQYQTFLDKSMRELFQTNMINWASERKILLYYDQTTMEKNICETLLFSTSREIMRTTVRLVCGAPANSVSLLFYLHQCYRTSSATNHLGGLNTRFREKLLGHCRKRLSNKLQQSVADITLKSISIKEIRTYSEQVILETIKGETTYICNLLAMALKPDQLHNIQVEDQLLSEEKAGLAKGMIPGRGKKFNVQYARNFWTKQGYSGDIFSMRGPIIWAMEKPRMSSTGSLEKYSGLIGYLMVRDDGTDSKEAVLEQLVKLFGEEAATPVSYKETPIADIYIPRCGDYVALRKLTNEGSPKFLEWGALDIFADGDVAAALEAGHTAYLHLLGCLRPQAQSYEDIIVSDWPTFLSGSPVKRWMSQFNVISGIKLTVYSAALLIGIKLIHSYMRK